MITNLNNKKPKSEYVANLAFKAMIGGLRGVFLLVLLILLDMHLGCVNLLH
ncbi:hypothetical protein [Wolbachia endosymbiont of Ctenocephalides felis wCfeT]|uniref:hypothetical protein n=1 Tax=Wolbachia endosymbiont of Ctenocephalides felis wCfeT TaxID=2732593 RepID=UPI001444D4F7|nr:hypothetical protein [Wolbachia endosymbiont of Ctenocephalides felis wCfeT]